MPPRTTKKRAVSKRIKDDDDEEYEDEYAPKIHRVDSQAPLTLCDMPDDIISLICMAGTSAKSLRETCVRLRDAISKDSLALNLTKATKTQIEMIFRGRSVCRTVTFGKSLEDNFVKKLLTKNKNFTFDFETLNILASNKLTLEGCKLLATMCPGLQQLMCNSFVLPAFADRLPNLYTLVVPSLDDPVVAELVSKTTPNLQVFNCSTVRPMSELEIVKKHPGSEKLLCHSLWPNLRRVDGTEETSKWIEMLTKKPYLQTIKLYPRATDVFPSASLPTFPSMQVLECTKHVVHAVSFPNLRFLSMERRYSNATDTNPINIAEAIADHAPNIETLVMDFTPGMDTRPLNRLRSLKHLQLSTYHYNEPELSLAAIQELPPYLVTLKAMVSSDEHVKMILRQCPCLENLSLHSNYRRKGDPFLGDKTAAAIAKYGRGIVQLDISSTIITNAGIKLIAEGLPNLRCCIIGKHPPFRTELCTNYFCQPERLILFDHETSEYRPFEDMFDFDIHREQCVPVNVHKPRTHYYRRRRYWHF